ncbi:MAG: rhomboid family intramembrane serine protease [Planctomycetia bacterium]|nr:rhomboid family intramembrane serine protease [Planctomycetia bacterium]
MLLLPVSDDNPTQRRPVLTQAILALNIAIWLLGAFTVGDDRMFLMFGLVPADFTFPSLLTSQFIHAGIFHLAGNMLFFWIFADNVEDRLGRAWFLLMYLASGAAGAIAHAVAVMGTETAHIPLGGASGAISGVLAAYLVFYPQQPVRIFFLFFLYPGFFHVRAVWVIGAYAAQQILMIMAGATDNVAYWAHLGGFGAGLAFALADRWRRGLPEELLPAGEGWRRRAGRQPSGVTRIWKRLGPEALVQPPRPEAPPIEVPFARIAEGWTVLRADDALADVSAVAALVSRATGEPHADAVRRIRATRGVLARGLSADAANRLLAALAAAGGPPAFAIDEASAGPLPPPAFAASASAVPDGFVFEMADGGNWAVPWSRVAAVYAARVDRHAPGAPRGLGALAERFIETTLVDVITRDPAGRIRLAQDKERLGAVPSESATPEMQAFCSAILRFRGPIPVNNGVAVAAGKGHWGYLRFPGEADYEDYAWWLTQLIRRWAGSGKPHE